MLRLDDHHTRFLVAGCCYIAVGHFLGPARIGDAAIRLQMRVGADAGAGAWQADAWQAEAWHTAPHRHLHTGPSGPICELYLTGPVALYCRRFTVTYS